MGKSPENYSATNVAAAEKIFPRVQVNQTSTARQGGQARNAYEEAPPTRARLPERDYDADAVDVGDYFKSSYIYTSFTNIRF